MTISYSRKCPVCHGINLESLKSMRFELPSGHPIENGYNVVYCCNCGFIYADVKTSQDELDSYYSNLSKYEDQTSTGSGFSIFDKTRLMQAGEIIFSWLDHKESRIIDIGCANGGLLRVLKDNGLINLTGVDPSINCVENTKQLVGCEAFVGSISSLPKDTSKYDCIILSHVLEHIYDLNILEEVVNSALSNDGIIYIEIPDGQNFSKHLTSPFQEFNTEHINYFSITSLRNLFLRLGCSPVFESQQEILIGDGILYPVVRSIFCKVKPKKPLECDSDLRKGIIEYIEKSQALLSDLESKIRGIIQKSSPVIIWGTGQLTMKLLVETSLRDADIYCFVDGNPINHGKDFMGRKIYSPSHLLEFPDYPILICTLLHQKEITSNIYNLGIKNKLLTLD